MKSRQMLVTGFAAAAVLFTGYLQAQEQGQGQAQEQAQQPQPPAAAQMMGGMMGGMMMDGSQMMNNMMMNGRMMGARHGGYAHGMMRHGKAAWQAGNEAAAQFDPAERVARMLESMKSRIKPTAEQEPLWLDYEEKMNARAGMMQSMRAMHAQTGLNAAERMQQMQQMMETGMAVMKEVSASFITLYASLQPEQKAIADNFAAGGGEGGCRFN